MKPPKVKWKSLVKLTVLKGPTRTRLIKSVCVMKVKVLYLYYVRNKITSCKILYQNLSLLVFAQDYLINPFSKLCLFPLVRF